MLRNLDPVLSAELLYVLASMGHGDELALVDANFPAAAVAADTVSRTLVRLDGADCPRAAQAILSVLPLDSFVEEPVRRMQVVGSPDDVTGLQREVLAVAREAEGAEVRMGSLERFDFYEAARGSYAVVATTELRPYGCFLLRKGVILL